MYKLRYVWQSYTVKAGYESNRPFCLLLNIFSACLLPLAKAWGCFIFGVSMTGYGLISPVQTKHYAQAVCDVLGGGEAAVRLLCETAAAETLCGTLPDKTRHGAGRGLLQCDKIAFDDVVARSRQDSIIALERAFDFDLKRVEWDDLNYSPILAMSVARLHYRLVPAQIPLSLKARAEYWKRYYNTAMGKGSIADYLFRVDACEKYF